jgi:hypothetical protein
LTDIDLSLTVVGGWNPSYVAAFNADGGRGGRFDTRIFSVRNTRGDCRTSASVYLSADKQTVRCDGGSLPGTVNACGLRIVPERNTATVAAVGSQAGTGHASAAAATQGVPSQATASAWNNGGPSVGRLLTDLMPQSTWFIKYVSMDPNGTDHWYCRQHEDRNRFSLTGSYYYAFVKVASCPPPVGEFLRELLGGALRQVTTPRM